MVEPIFNNHQRSCIILKTTSGSFLLVKLSFLKLIRILIKQFKMAKETKHPSVLDAKKKKQSEFEKKYFANSGNDTKRYGEWRLRTGKNRKR